MKSIISRYLATSFIFPFLASCSFFIVFLLTFQFFKFTKIIINKEIPAFLIAEMILHLGNTFLPLSIPLSAYFAALYTLKKMSLDSEYIVMRSLGLAKWDIFKPLLLLGLLLTFTIFSLGETIIPLSRRRFQEITANITSKGMLSSIQKEQFYFEIPHFTIFAQNVENKGELLEKLFIHIKSPKFGENEEKIIMAERGELLKEGKEEDASIEMLRFKLYQGSITKSSPDHRYIEKILFDTYDFPIDLSQFKNGVASKESMKSTSTLYQSINLKERNPLIVTEFWERIYNAFQPTLFIFLGLLFGIQSRRGPSKKVDLLSFFAPLFYYSLYFTSLSMARKESSYLCEL